jgi:type III pantothenate kinase
MLLAIECGNTSTTFGIWNDDILVSSIHNETTSDWSLNDLSTIIGRLYEVSSIGSKNIDGVVVSSVAPSIDSIISQWSNDTLTKTPLFISAVNSGLQFQSTDGLDQLGSDRIANAVAGYAHYDQAVIVVDMGTATTFDYIDQDGVYYGGPIIPGIKIFNDSLSEKTEKLPYIEIAKRDKFIPTNTIEAVQTGVYHGYAGMVNHLVAQLKRQTDKNSVVIATGGYAPLISEATAAIEDINPHLTLEGLKIIWNRNLS